jgi:signal transduction histidine kinase
MEERTRELGGTIEIRSAPGAGTRVRLEVSR